ncbi:hypothetical protein GQ53DRAFT_686599 [Thozetella sp. PMI_491]|nr:hypothetical protein GQ53DRAFT_686599 [Thozetella sp. PMI_491]
MTSIFNGTARMVHSSKLPETTTRKQAVAMLQDHEFFLHCDPHMSKFEKLADMKPTTPVPETVKGTGGEECYTVTDVVQALPAGLWDSNVVSTYEFTDTEDGIFVRIRSPLKVVLDTIWTIQGEDGQLEMVEDANIECSRVLVSVVKSQCEGGWAQIHGKMIDRLKSEVAPSA